MTGLGRATFRFCVAGFVVAVHFSAAAQGNPSTEPRKIDGDITIVNNTTNVLSVARETDDVALGAVSQQGKETFKALLGDHLLIRNMSDHSNVLRRIAVYPTKLSRKDGSFFEKANDDYEWNEWDRNGALEATYIEASISDGFIHLWNEQKLRSVFLPVSGEGNCLVQEPDEHERKEVRNCQLAAEHVNNTVSINPPPPTFNDLSHVESPDFEAMLHGYDLKKVDPLDQTAGQTSSHGRQLFFGLSPNSTDYWLSNRVAVLAGLDYDFIGTGKGSTFSEMVYTARQLQEAWNVDISVGGGNTDPSSAEPTRKSGQASVSYGEMSSNMEQNGSYYFISRRTDELYKLKVMPPYMKLTQEFISAVQSLPAPTGGLIKDRDQTYQAYKGFVEIWGDHYLSEAVYGGAIFLTIELNSSTITELNKTELNIGLAAQAVLGPVPASLGIGFGKTREAVFKEKVERRHEQFYYVGGQGSSPESFSVSSDNANPIKRTFAPLSDLLVPILFRDIVPPEQLSAKRAMLAAVIDDLYPEPVQEPELALKVYELEITSMVLEEAEGDPELYGRVWGTADPFFLPGSRAIHPFDRMCCAKRSKIAKNAEYRLNSRLRNVSPPTVQRQTFSVKADLKAHYHPVERLISGELSCSITPRSEDDVDYGSWDRYAFDAYWNGPAYERWKWKVRINFRCREVPRWAIHKHEWNSLSEKFKEFCSTRKNLISHPYVRVPEACSSVPQ